MLCSSDEDGEEGKMETEGSESNDGNEAVEGEESDNDALGLAAAFDSGGEGESSDEDEGASSDDDDERGGAAATKGAKQAAPVEVCPLGGAEVVYTATRGMAPLGGGMAKPAQR